MKYNKWKEANDYWRMVINKPFKVKGRNVMLLNYIATYYNRSNKSSYVTKTMHRFINYLNNISKEIYYHVAELNTNKYFLLYRDVYRKDLIGINPYISITYEQMKAIDNFIDTFRHYEHAYCNNYRLRKQIVNSLLDAIDKISPIQDVLRQYRYNRTHKRKHPYLIVSNNLLEHDGYPYTQYYDNYKQFYSDYLRRKIGITKTFYKYHSSLDVYNIFNKRNT